DLVEVEVTVSENAIESVTVTAHQETPGIGAPLTEEGYEGDIPIVLLPQTIVEQQSIGVDGVAGATFTSNAIKNAVKDALTQAGANPDEWKEVPEKPAPEEKELTADVVILGAGGSGLASAISALENGAENVILVEKCGAVGGDTLVCGAIYNTPDEPLQSVETMTDAKKATIEAALAKEPVSEEHKALQEEVAKEYAEYQEAGRTDIFDSEAWFALQTFDGGDDIADLDLVKVLTYNAKDGFDWIVAKGMQFADKIGQGAGSLWQRTHTSIMQMGTGFITTYVNTLAGYGDKVTILTSTTAKSIVKDDSGKVVGATAEDRDGNTYTLHANKGVVLATGGFAANAKMAQEYNTSGKWNDLSNVKTTNRYACSQGDGITMATEIGADLFQMDQIQLLYLGNLKDGQLTKYPARVVNGTDQEIFINKEGKRFVQEDGRRDQICLASLEQTDGMFYFLESADGNYVDIDEAISADGFSLRFLEEQGYIYVADTLEEMTDKLNAAGANMTAEELKATVEAFNQCVEND
ncbi:MAG: FAD-dependent oxidoreductase, partial [Blautia sp.]|nr:FAD-dependent oxidoreductase [Blautia sp.]